MFRGEFTNVKQLFSQRFDAFEVSYEVNSLPADILAIATQGLVNAKYRGSQILSNFNPAEGESEQDFTA
jgi:hypothetical protein